MVVDEDDEILLINSEGTIIRIKANEVSKLGRATQGVKIMRSRRRRRTSYRWLKVIREEEHEREYGARHSEKKAEKKSNDDEPEQTKMKL